MSLSIENLIGEVASCNLRKETHGEELRLACDVSLIVKRDGKVTNPNAFDALVSHIVAVLPDDAPGANTTDESLETLEALTGIADAITFSASWENHRVSIRQSTRKIVIFSHAKLNKVRLVEAGVLSLRIQCQVDSASVGRIAGALREHVSIDVSPAQTELDLDETDQSDATTN